MLLGVVFITKTKTASSENNLLPPIFTMGELWNIIQTDSGSYGRTFNLFFLTISGNWLYDYRTNNPSDVYYYPYVVFDNKVPIGPVKYPNKKTKKWNERAKEPNEMSQ